MNRIRTGNLLTAGGVLLFAALFIVYSAQIRHTILQALSLAVETVIPGLFPFLVLSDFACRARLLPVESKAARFVAEKMFSLPASALPAVLFGLTGGFVTGVKTACVLAQSGCITKEQAKRICLFCVSPGLAFSVCAVGNAMLGSTQAGILLFASCTAAACITGMLLPAAQEDNGESIAGHSTPQKAECFTQAVQNSAAICVSLSAWMALFASVQAVCKALLPSSAEAVFSLFAEVSAGCLQAAKAGQLPLCAAVSGFAGLCILCQLLPDLLKLDVNILQFLKYRLLQSGLSALLCKAGLFLFPQLGISKTVANVYLSRVNPTASFFLLLMCFIFILDLAPTKKMCYDVKWTKNIRIKG